MSNFVDFQVGSIYFDMEEIKTVNARPKWELWGEQMNIVLGHFSNLKILGSMKINRLHGTPSSTPLIRASNA